jgi:phospholipase C
LQSASARVTEPSLVTFPIWGDRSDDEAIPNAPVERPPRAPASSGPQLSEAGRAARIDTILDALGSRPDVWAKTVFIINYDENDGRFDHVPPPTAPEGTPGEWATVSPVPSGASGIAGPVGLGFRVPALVISPLSRGG